MSDVNPIFLRRLRDLNPVSIAALAGWAVVMVLALILALVSLPAHAKSMIAVQGDNQAVLTDQPCTSQKVLDRLAVGTDASQFHQAFARVDKQYFSACWHLVGNSVHLLYEDGDQGVLPVEMFREMPEA